MTQNQVDQLINAFSNKAYEKYQGYGYSAGYLASALKFIMSSRTKAEFEFAKQDTIDNLLKFMAE